MREKIKERTMMKMLPCQRCGLSAVPVTIFFSTVNRDTLDCRACGATHYLAVRRHGNKYEVTYNLYTLRYPLENYDDIDLDVVRMSMSEEINDESEIPETPGGPGPIYISPRKKRFTKEEVYSIWIASKMKCHICGKKWKSDQRGMNGWHIDHIIPHIGGGVGTERIENMRVACARCNLSKGKGYSEKTLKNAIRDLVDWIAGREAEVKRLSRIQYRTKNKKREAH
ncbi:MAG TPA: HNH endonuclease signature motif containing protein [bacterium]|jgi:transcription elongation factor Elf1|nr:HNH endonuclease signature motif containing protein [bacterium]